MNRDKSLTCLWAAVLAFLISFGGVACMTTGMTLNIAASELGKVILFCAVFSAVAAVSLSFRRGGWILLGVLALLGGYLWRTGALEVSMEALLYRITYIYDRAYGCGVAQWTGLEPMRTSPALAFCVIETVIIILTAWAVCRSRRAYPAVSVGFIPLFACLVVTDTVPAAWSLFLLLTGMVLLILTNTVRRMNRTDGNRLTAMLLVPVMLFMLLMFWAVPSDGYSARPDELQQDIIAWFEELRLNGLLSSKIPGNNSGFRTGGVDLTTVGPKNQQYYAVMDVTGAQNGVLYLRGQSLDSYDGKTWSPSESSTGADRGWPRNSMLRIGTVTVSTKSGHAAKFFPYYPGGTSWPLDNGLKEGRLDNPFRQREYSFDQMQLVLGATAVVSLSEEMREQCLQLPQSTRSAAQKLLSSDVVDLGGMKNEKIARIIGDYVRQSAGYDLNTPVMPAYENDFALWFLNSGETGYCIHFATAATVLLRAAGVPARYVSGYVVDAEAGKKVTVTADLSHAWVEYFDPDQGWRILDPTPASWLESPDEPTLPSTEETTQPEETTDSPTVSTEPPDQPTEETTQPAIEPTLPGEDPQDSENQKPEMDLSWLWIVLVWFGSFLGALAVLIGQYLLRQRIRSRKMHTGPVNQRALARWRAVLRISGILKKQPPERLQELAEKARFSQHELSVPERMEFDQYLDEADLELRQKPWLKQWLIRLFWAL